MRCLLDAKSKRKQETEQGTSCPYSGHSPLPIPQRHGDRRKEQGGRRRRRRKMRRRKRQEVRANSPHWLPGPFWVVLNGPEQR